MIIWKGLGFLGALIPLVFILVSNSTLGSDVVGWAILTSAIPVWLLGRYSYKRPAKTILDPKTKQLILVKPEHSLFWVELNYWAVMIVIYGIPFLLPENLTSVAMQIALLAIIFIFIGRLGFNLYHKYFKNENATSNKSISPTINEHPKEDKLSRFATKSRDKKKLNQGISTKNSPNKEQGLPASELRKKAFYAQMRKDRETPKKFADSIHQSYFPGNKMPFIPQKAILDKDTVFEEE